MRPRRSPQPLSAAVSRLRDDAAPRTVLAAAQSAWTGVAGPGVAAQAEPVAERDGVLTIACRSATWAQELDLLQDELLERLNAALRRGRSAGPMPPVRRLRFTADAARHFYS